MVTAQREPVRAGKQEAPSETDVQLSLLQSLQSDSASNQQYLRTITDVQTLSDTCLNLYRIIELLHNPPDEDDPRYAVYQEAVNRLGNGDAESAKQVLVKALQDSLGFLTTSFPTAADLGEERINALGNMITELYNKIDTQEGVEAGYGFYRPVRAPAIALWNMLFSGREIPALPPGAIRAGAEEIPLFEPPLPEFGRIILVSGTEDAGVAYAPGASTPTLDASFASDEDAVAAADAYGNALSRRENFEGREDRGDPSLESEESRAIGQALHDALARVTNPSLTGSENFQAALDALAGCGESGGRCDLAAALDALGSDTVFSGVASEMDHFYKLEISPRSLSVTHVGIRIMVDWDDNIESFQRFLVGNSQDPYLGFMMLRMGFGFWWEGIQMSAALTGQRPVIDETTGRLSFVPGTFGETTGSGNVYGGEISAELGGTMNGLPTVVRIHLSAGGQDWGVTGRLDMPGGSSVPIPGRSSTGMFWGINGIDMTFPRGPHDASVFHFEGFGASVAGPLQGAMGSVTMSVGDDWSVGGGHRMALRTYFTPRVTVQTERPLYGGDVDVSLGLETELVRFTYQWAPEGAISISPTFNFDQYVTTDVTTFGPSLGIVLTPCTGVTIPMGFGYSFSEGGAPGEAPPAGWTGGATIILTPQRWWGEKAARPEAEKPQAPAPASLEQFFRPVNVKPPSVGPAVPKKVKPEREE